MHSRNRIAPHVGDVEPDHAWTNADVKVTLPSEFGGVTGYLTRDELEALVQQAYDRHGVVAQLWTATDGGSEA